MKPEERKSRILAHAAALAVVEGYNRMSQSQVARQAKVSKALVPHYFSDMQGLRDAVMRDAVDREALPVIAQGLVARHPLALAASATLRRRAARSLCS